MTETPTRTPDGPRLGRYRLLSKIGEGGMGVVHLAEDETGHRVALKVLRPHVVGDEEGRRRLAQEVASLREVHSAHVAEILDADPWGETPYVVTRYVPGLPLSTLVEHQGPVPGRELLHLARELLRAITDVHAAGVLHRDVKPSNVLMEGRAPILIDFGLARMLEDPRLTTTGWMLGTPGYLAPEVLWGHDATAASDVHAWAATVAFAATGRTPYGRGHTMAVLDRTRRGEVDLDGVPADLLPLLRSCLASDPGQRPSTAQAAAWVDALLGHGAGPIAGPDLTQPWQVAAGPAEPPTVGAKIAPIPPSPTRRYTVAAPVQQPPPFPAYPASGSQGPVPAYPVPVGRPVPAPYASPAYEAARYGAAPPTVPAAPTVSRHRGLVTLLLLSLLGVVTLAYARDALAALLVVGIGVLLVRGQSHAADSGWMRRLRRGGRRWYDAPRTVAAYPWHVLRGSIGAAVLMLCATAAAFAVTGSLRLLGFSETTSLLTGGLALGLATWTGPGAARVRRPLRRAAERCARSSWSGALVAAGLAGAAALVVLLPSGGLLPGGPLGGETDLVPTSWRP